MPINNPGGSSPAGSPYTLAVRGPSFLVTRPNNVTAYVVGGVYGDGVDARVQLVVPALPVGAKTGGFSSLALYAVNSRGGADAQLQLALTLFRAQPATVLKDQDQLALSDADILLTMHTNANPQAGFTWASGSGATNVLNDQTGVNGRRVANAGTQGDSDIPFQPGATVWGYLWATAGYVPVALETILLVPYWSCTINIPVA